MPGIQCGPSLMLHHSYDATLVVLSFVVACVASFAALQLAGRVLVAAGRTRLLWLVGSAVTMGAGIWSMHFVAMLAFKVPVPIAYDVPLVILSVVVAIAASLLAFITVSRPSPRFSTLAVASVFMGPAIAGMHYIGMASLRMAATIQYDPALVTLSVAIAVTASLAALRLFVAFRDDDVTYAWWGKPASAVLMAVAVCGMHYTGMMAAQLIPSEPPDVAGRQLLATDGLAYAVSIAATMIAAIAVVAVMLDRSVRARLAEGDAIRASEERLRESEERLRIALSAARMATWELDLDARLVYRTEGAASSPPRVESLDAFLARVHPEDRGAFDAALLKARTEETFDLDYRLTRSDGSTAWVNSKGQRAAGGSAKGLRLVGVSTNITERRHLEDQFRHAQKMEAVGQLAGGIAHDFNNLLTVITGNVELLLDNIEPGDPRRAGLQDVLAASGRAAALTRQLLAFSRKQFMQPRPVNLNAVIRDLEPTLLRLIGDDIVIATHLDPADPAAMVDRGQLDQILMNLAVNARDAMVAGGTLRIETATASVTLTEGTPADLASGRFVMLKVTDTGTGMHPDVRARAFEPFFTTKDPSKGTGLGLSTVYGIVKQSGGHIIVESEPGKGTAFTIYLREASAPAADVNAAGKARADACRGSETILLAEDEAGVRKLACQLLRRQGYRVIEAENGVDALEKARVCDEGTPHALVTDLVMPGMGGRELAERLLQMRPNVRVLFMSGYSNDAVLRHGLNPTTAFIAKPFAAKDFVAAVRSMLDRQEPSREA